MPTAQFKLNLTEILWSYSVQQADWRLTRNSPAGAFTA